MNAYAYLRVSTRGQVDGDGFPRQALACDAYAAANGLRILRTFQEEGVCGASELDNRPALQELYAAIATSEVRTIVIERLDRLARDLMVQETIISDLRKNGITLISTAEPDLCSDDPSRKLIRQIFGAIAEYDRAMVVMKLRGARQRKRARDGRCEGRKPFGHTHDEAVVLSNMIRLRAKGHKHSTIASILNADQIPARSGGFWHGGTVSKILGREVVLRAGQNVAS